MKTCHCIPRGAALMATATSPCGEIGRRAALKMRYRKMCWFESGQGHQIPFMIGIYRLNLGLRAHVKCSKLAQPDLAQMLTFFASRHYP